MKLITQLKNKRYEKWYILLFNIVLTILIIACFYPIYETNDDFSMSMILSGAYGDNYRQNIIFSNIVLGYILKYVYIIFPRLNWYVILQYVSITVSISVIVNIIAQKTNIFAALIINCLGWYLFVYDSIRSVQFTKTACVLMVAGCVSLLYYTYKNNIRYLFSGCILFALGVMFRSDCIYIVLPFFGVMLLSAIKKVGIKKVVKVFLVTIIISVVFISIDSIYYNTSADWKYFNNYNKYRSKVLDYPFPDYEMNQDVFESIGYSKNDVQLLDGWTIADDNKFTLDSFMKISNLQKRPQYSFMDYFLFFVSKCKNSSFVIWIFLILLVLFTQNWNKKICGVFCMIGTFLLFALFYYLQRILPRLEYSIWFSAVVTCVVLLIFDNENRLLNSATMGVAAAVMSCIFLSWGVNHYMSFHNHTEENSSLIEYMHKHDDSIFVIDISKILRLCDYEKPYKGFPNDYLNNVIYTATWEYNSPFYKEKLKSLGITNTLTDVVDKDNVYFITKKGYSIKKYIKYYKENYNYDCKGKKIKTIDGKYRIISIKKEEGK